MWFHISELSRTRDSHDEIKAPIIYPSCLVYLVCLIIGAGLIKLTTTLFILPVYLRNIFLEQKFAFFITVGSQT